MLSSALNLSLKKEFITKLAPVSTVEKVRLCAISAKYSNDWKLAYPCHSATTLSNRDYEIISRLSLGLKPYDTLPKECSSCHRKNSPIECYQIDKGDIWHYISCPLRRNNELAIRHNQINLTLRKIVDLVGGVSVVEPANLDPDNRLRPDQQIILDKKEFIIDVSIVHPASQSYLNLDCTKRSLGLAESKAMSKTLKYHDLLKKRNGNNNQKSIFVPFILETFGGISRSGADLLKEINIFSQQNQSVWTSDEIKFILRFSISCALQRGNAAAIRQGYLNDSHFGSSRRI